MKRLGLSLLLILLVTILFNINVDALELNSKYAVLYNLNDDDIIYDLHKDEVISIASLTKIMTTLVAIENIRDYNQEIILNEEMFQGLREANAYVINLKVGQKVTYNDLLYGMFLASGADATRAIAISIAGSEENFVLLMNKKAETLGLDKTHFQNTVGLDADTHYSTVNEVAIILKNAFKNQKFKEIFTTEKYTISDGSITVQNSMKKAATVYGIDVKNVLGAKTGYTGNAGRCLASIAYDEKNKITYLLVTTKAETIKQPITDASKTYEYYFNNYKYQTLVKKNDLLVELHTKYSKVESMKFFAQEDIKKYLKNDFLQEDVKLNYVGKKTITPLTKKNEKLGSVEIVYQEKVVKKIDIILPKVLTFSFIGFIAYYKYIFICLLVALICFIIIIFTKYRKNKKNQRKY